MTTAEDPISIKLPSLTYDVSPFDIHEGKSHISLKDFCSAFNEENHHLSDREQRNYITITLRAMMLLTFESDEQETSRVLQDGLLAQNPDITRKSLANLVKLINFQCGEELDLLAAIMAKKLKEFRKAGVPDEDLSLSLMNDWFRDTVFGVIDEVYGKKSG